MGRISSTIVALLLLAVLPAQAQTKITVSYGPGYPWIPAFVAKDQGIFAQHGLDVTLQFIAVGSNQPAALIAGTSQVAGLSPPIVLFADEGGADIAIVAGANGQSKQGTTGGVLARPEAKIATAADFKGKKVGVPGLQSAYHIAFMKWLQDRGIAPSDVTYVEVPINQMNDSLRSGATDAVVAAAPFFGQILAAKTGVKVGDFLADLADPFTVYSAWAMSRGYMTTHPEVAPAFRASIREAMTWIEHNMEAAQRSQITYLKLPEAIALNTRIVDLTAEVTPAQMQWWIDAVQSLGLIKNKIPLRDVLAD
ncbi:MAG TPA: ABC transporter substrate-binding protein [Stellaceae bacterium]|jgi:NitT/TauT family transport system substrate-binding protein